ncbi:hypothetical protein GGI43DRAFT_395923 [Trichoderma evansii]
MLPHARIFSLPRYLCTLVVSAAARVPGGDRPASSSWSSSPMDLWSSLFLAVSFLYPLQLRLTRHSVMHLACQTAAYGCYSGGG